MLCGCVWSWTLLTNSYMKTMKLLYVLGKCYTIHNLFILMVSKPVVNELILNLKNESFDIMNLRYFFLLR
jgi:hypothetical protein